MSNFTFNPQIIKDPPQGNGVILKYIVKERINYLEN